MKKDVFSQIISDYERHIPKKPIRKILKKQNLKNLKKTSVKIGNEIYSHVNSVFINKFKGMHLFFIKNYYYFLYKDYCLNNNIALLNKEKFFKDINKIDINIYQLCCPYCGFVKAMIHDKTRHPNMNLNFCGNCGTGSVSFNINNQLLRLNQISEINSIGLKALKKNYKDVDIILGVGSFQMEIIVLTSILESMLWTYFKALFRLYNVNIRQSFSDKILKNYNNNSFMNIDKTNQIFKETFGINIKKIFDSSDKSIWKNLLEITSMRNVIVHNNGKLDEKFRNSEAFKKINVKGDNNYVIIKKEDIEKYKNSVVVCLNKISEMFLKEFNQLKNIFIANYYFNF